MLKVVPNKSELHQGFEWTLDEIATEGARRFLIQALNLKVKQCIQLNKNEVVTTVHNGFQSQEPSPGA